MNGKWKILILKELIRGPVRFGLLNKAIPLISSKVLTQQLKELEKDGLIIRTVYAEVPARVEYNLSEMGTSMLAILTEMRKWGLHNDSLHPVKCSYCQQCEPLNKA
ncbi:helix-turn-helix domain-containing protein [Dehalobacter restrictus]|uniref:winged helix-turn-helix transcriptional regulator n=1 Tax=Dehalobacter restrictus TaxID=55583 RepID=UPI00338F88FC